MDLFETGQLALERRCRPLGQRHFRLRSVEKRLLELKMRVTVESGKILLLLEREMLLVTKVMEWQLDRVQGSKCIRRLRRRDVGVRAYDSNTSKWSAHATVNKASGSEESFADVVVESRIAQGQVETGKRSGDTSQAYGQRGERSVSGSHVSTAVVAALGCPASLLSPVS